MGVDSHQHYWRCHPATDAWITDEMALLKHDFLLVDLVPELRANSIDVCGGAGRLIRRGNPLSARARLNNLSLMALTISTGFVVDDAVVMIENIARYTNVHHIEHVQCAAPCRRITRSPRDSRKLGINR